MLETFASIGPLFLLLALGLVAGYFPRFRNAEAALNGFVFYFALPAFLFQAVATAPVSAGAPPAFFVIASGVTLAICLLTYVSARALARCTPPQAAPISLAAAYGNVGYLGVPIVISIVGPDAALAAALGQLIHNLMFMVGYPLIRSISKTSSRQDETTGRMLWRVTKRALLLNPVAISVTAGLVVSLSGATVPVVAEASISLLGQAAIPTAMFTVGLTLKPALDGIRAGGVSLPAVLAATAVKIIALPLVTLAATRIMQTGLTETWSATLILMAAMPTSTTAFILSGEYDKDGRLAAAVIVLTSAISVVSIPISVSLLL